MRKYKSEEIRNIGLFSHSGAGTTTIADAMLFDAKVTNRLCRVDDGNSNFDFTPEEIKRGSSASTAVGFVEWEKTKINIIDAPGDFNFINEAILAAEGVDTAVIVVSAVDGVEVGTEKVWSIASDKNLAKVIFVNKMDRERANFEETIEDIKKSFTVGVTPLQIPIGKEESFKGIIDLLTGKAHIYKDESGEYSVEDVPAEYKDMFEEARNNLIEGIAENDEALMEKYFEEGTLSDEEIVNGIKEGIKSGDFIPVLCGSALKNIGIKELLDFIKKACPSPLERAPIKAIRKDTNEEVEIELSPDAPFTAKVFKTIVDPYAGKLTVFRIFSGKLQSDTVVYNSSLDISEKFGTLYQIQGKKLENLGSATTGDIAVVAKLKETKTLNTLCDKSFPVVFPLPEIMKPIMSFAIKPKSQGDEEKISQALQRLKDEDISFELSRDEQTLEFILSGLGQVHIEMIVERLKKKFNVDVDLSTPKVPYKETIKKKVTNIEGKYKKQSGGRGQYGICYIDLEPLPRGGGFEFIDNIVGGAIPKNYIPSVEKGIIEAMQKGIIAGYPVVDVRVRLFDGKYHPVDSSDMAFKIAGSLAFKAGAAKADPTILEPIMEMEITIPKENLGDIMGDLNSRRGRITALEDKGKNNIIKALVPMVEVLRYAPDLKSMTSGRGTYIMKLAGYEEVPAQLKEKIIEESKKEKE